MRGLVTLQGLSEPWGAVSLGDNSHAWRAVRDSVARKLQPGGRR